MGPELFPPMDHHPLGPWSPLLLGNKEIKQEDSYKGIFSDCFLLVMDSESAL